MSSFPAADSVILLCLDVQPTFLKVMAEAATLEKRCQLAVASAAGLGLTTVFTEQVPEKLGPTSPSLLSLAADPKTIFAKTAFSALRDPQMEAFLSDHPVTHLLICGLETPVCVYQTAADALERGLGVTLLSDAIGARRPADAEVALAELARAGAHILPTETVFYALLGDTTHPFFRAYTQLVKSHG